MNDEKNATDQLTEAVDNLVAAINETPPFNWIGAAIEWLVDKLAAILERGTGKEKIMDDAKITVPGISAAEATENIRKNMELLDRPPLSERTREEFRRIFNDKIGLRRREGAEKLLDWMERNGFFEAPASTKHHLAIPGGLALHSLNVYHRLEEILEREKENEQIFSLAEIEESMAIMALLHDICKTDCYHRDPETGAYTFRDPLPLGHGEKSVYIITRYMELYPTEALAIRWHMGAYDDAVKGGTRAFNAAMKMTPWVWRLHQADMIATWEDERSGDNGNA